MLSKNIAKYIQSSHHKKFRDSENVFIAEGAKVVEELLISQKFICKNICGTGEWMSANERLLKGIHEENILIVTEVELQKISLQKTPNNVLAIFFKKQPEAITLKKSITIMLDAIQDPGNLGTIIRIADWFGVRNIICSKETADCYNPKVVQSTMGSLPRVNIYYTDLENFIKDNTDIKFYAATLDGRNVSTIDKISEGVILIGNEARGVNNDLVKLADYKITIPGKGNAESLNAAVATGIILSHLT